MTSSPSLERTGTRGIRVSSPAGTPANSPPRSPSSGPAGGAPYEGKWSGVPGIRRAGRIFPIEIFSSTPTWMRWGATSTVKAASHT
jgi:hypothetical protein